MGVLRAALWWVPLLLLVVAVAVIALHGRIQRMGGLEAPYRTVAVAGTTAVGESGTTAVGESGTTAVGATGATAVGESAATAVGETTAPAAPAAPAVESPVDPAFQLSPYHAPAVSPERDRCQGGPEVD